MELEFSVSGYPKWKLTDNYLYYQKKEIPLSEIIDITICNPMGFMRGEIDIKLIGKTFPIRLMFSKKQQQDAELATKYIEQHSSFKNYKMKCAVCGQIICYTQRDLKRNNANQTLVNLYATQHIMHTLGGSSYHKYETAKRADAAMTRIVDYTKCPNCGSSELIDISEDSNLIENTSNTSTDVDNIELLKKYKELYDTGIITQEEFEAKKKQILGL